MKMTTKTNGIFFLQPLPELAITLFIKAQTVAKQMMLTENIVLFPFLQERRICIEKCIGTITYFEQTKTDVFSKDYYIDNIVVLGF